MQGSEIENMTKTIKQKLAELQNMVVHFIVLNGALFLSALGMAQSCLTKLSTFLKTDFSKNIAHPTSNLIYYYSTGVSS